MKATCKFVEEGRTKIEYGKQSIIFGSSIFSMIMSRVAVKAINDNPKVFNDIRDKFRKIYEEGQAAANKYQHEIYLCESSKGTLYCCAFNSLHEYDNIFDTVFPVKKV